MSDFIPCKPETKYYFDPSGMERIVYYNQSKTVLSASTGVYGGFTTPANCKYFRFTNALSRANLNMVQITENEAIAKYEKNIMNMQ